MDTGIVLVALTSEILSVGISEHCAGTLRSSAVQAWVLRKAGPSI